MYTENELVAIAKRENNNKRKYLVVNKYQGKHIPVNPNIPMKMFKALGDQLKGIYRGKRLLLIGFAETATAIGAAVAGCFDCYYMQTTRELVEGGRYLYFSESHSHATEQKLVKNQLGEILGLVDRVIFVEDEITTGNTILDIIKVMKREFGTELRFSVASILNGMDQEAETRFQLHEIEIHYLVKTSHEAYDRMAADVKGDGDYQISPSGDGNDVVWKEYIGGLNARKPVNSQAYQSACRTFWEILDPEICRKQGDRILVLGTEEFMYPALYIASELEKQGCAVKFHATTRSPIVVSREHDYPVHSRFELRSFYDSQRTTYIYDLSSYDRVLVITDAPGEEMGWTSLKQALEQCNNKKTDWIRWCET